MRLLAAVEWPSTPEGWGVWAAATVGILAMVAKAAPGIFGSIGQAWDEWTDRRRRYAASEDDADIADLRRQVRGLQRRIEYMHRRAEEHNRWDREVWRRLQRAGLADDLELPPDLW